MSVSVHMDSISPKDLTGMHAEYRSAMYVSVRSCGVVDIQLGESDYYATYIDTVVEDIGRLLSWLRWHKVDHHTVDCRIVGCRCQLDDLRILYWDADRASESA